MPTETRILHGAPLAARVTAQVAERARALRDRGVIPTLALVSIGDDPASRVYLSRKTREGQKAGIDVRAHALAASEPPRVAFERIAGLAADPLVHGILLQMPLPPGWPSQELGKAVPAAKDVDGYHP